MGKAIIHPKPDDPRVYQTFRSEAEKLFYEKVVSEKDDFKDWLILFNLRISSFSQKISKKRETESDVLFIGPEGIINIEIKGGDHFSIDDGIVYWGYKDMKKRFMESRVLPLQQSKICLDAIREHLDKKLNESSASIPLKKINFIFAVAHPQCDLTKYKKELENTIEYDDKQVFDKNDRSVKGFIDRIFKSRNKGSDYNLSNDELQFIKKFLPHTLHYLPDNRSFEDLCSLEEDQIKIIDNCMNQKRIIVEGAAGTGKTFIAKYLCEKYDFQGKKILWLSYNKYFTSDIRDYFQRKKDYSNIEIHTYLSYLSKLILDHKRESKKRNPYALGEDIKNDFFNLLDYLDDTNTDLVRAKYDFVIVDEAQDIISMDFIFLLERILEKGIAEGSWAIFLDQQNQDIYKQYDEDSYKELYSHKESIFRLDTNMRNPPKVHEWLEDNYDINKVAMARTTISEVKELPISDADNYKESLLSDIIASEIKAGVDQDQIILLTPGSSANFIKNNLNQDYLEKKLDNPIILKKYSNKFSQDHNQSNNIFLFYSNISAFKGLEAKTVILFWNEEAVKSESLSNSYIALTRSLGNVYIIKS